MDNLEFYRTEIEQYFAKYEDRISQYDCAGGIPRNELAKIARDGYLGFLVDAKYGGKNLDIRYNAMLTEILMGRGMASLASSVLIQANSVAPLLSKYGSELCKDSYLIPLLQGEKIGSLAVTEPYGGSDLLNAIQTVAVKQADHYIISGQKCYITNAPIADFLVLIARTEEQISPLSFTLFLVPTASKGVEIEDLPKLGQISSQIGKIRLKNVMVPKSHVLGRVNRGYMYVSNVMLEERLLIGHGSVFFAEHCLQKTIGYTKQRKIGAQSLFDKQTIKHALAEYSSVVDCCKNFTTKVVREYAETKQLDKLNASICKFYVTERSKDVINGCVEMFGANSLENGTWMERYRRDVAILTIYAGSTETIKDLAASSLIPNLFSPGCASQ